jgi:hypothetical protein
MTVGDDEQHGAVDEIDALLRETGEIWRSSQPPARVDFTFLERAGGRAWLPRARGAALGVVSAAVIAGAIVMSVPGSPGGPAPGGLATSSAEPQGDREDSGNASPDGGVTSGGLEAPSQPSNVPVTMSEPSTDPEAARLAAIEAINTDSEQFGGVYIDEAGVLVIQYVGENRGRAAVERVLVPEVAVRWVQVERSQDELARIANEIRQRKLDGVFAISIETLTNRVEIWLDEYAPRSTLAAAFAAEYADAIFIRPGTDILYAGDDLRVDDSGP